MYCMQEGNKFRPSKYRKTLLKDAVGFVRHTIRTAVFLLVQQSCFKTSFPTCFAARALLLAHSQLPSKQKYGIPASLLLAKQTWPIFFEKCKKSSFSREVFGSLRECNISNSMPTAEPQMSAASVAWQQCLADRICERLWQQNVIALRLPWTPACCSSS